MLLDGGIMITIQLLYAYTAAVQQVCLSYLQYAATLQLAMHALMLRGQSSQHGKPGATNRKSKCSLMGAQTQCSLEALCSQGFTIYHLWHSAFRPFFFRASSASSRPAIWAHRLTTACLWKIKESMSGRVVVVVWYGSMVSISLKEHM